MLHLGVPAARTDFCTARILGCSKWGFLCQHTSVLSALIPSPPSSFTVKYWPDGTVLSKLASAG